MYEIHKKIVKFDIRASQFYLNKYKMHKIFHNLLC